MKNDQKINIYGEWYGGDSLEVKLTADMLPAEALVLRIESKIRSLRSLLDEFVIVELQDENSADKEFPVYFQTLRNRELNRTNTYEVELGMKIDRGTIHYIKDEATLEELLTLFRKICIDREKPQKNEWRIGSRIFSIKEKKTDTDKRLKRCRRLLSMYWRNEIVGQGAYFAKYDALEYIMENDAGYYDTAEAVRDYERRGLYSKLKDMFKHWSYNPVVAQINGEMAIHGIFGEPDYKTAYEYFIHAKTIGSLLAEYYIAKMYQYGLYVEKDHEEYEKRIRAVFSTYKNNRLICCPREILLEMSIIDQLAGDNDMAIKHCLTARAVEKESMSVGYCDITDTDRKITDRLYQLTEFDPNDMELLDLLYVLKQPCKVLIVTGRKQYTVQAVNKNGQTIVKCGKSYYRNAVEFLKRHKIKDKYLADMVEDIDYMEIL